MERAPPRKHTPILLEELQSEGHDSPIDYCGANEKIMKKKGTRQRRGGADLIDLGCYGWKICSKYRHSLATQNEKDLRKITSLFLLMPT